MSHSDRCQSIKFLKFEFEPLGIDRYGSANFARLHISAFVIMGTVYYGEGWENILQARSRFTAIPHPVMQDLAKTNLLLERYKGIVVQDEVYRWLPDYSVEVPGPHEIPWGSEISCVLCCDGIISGVIVKALEKSTAYYERIGALDNDPFVPVPVEALMGKATEKKLILVQSKVRRQRLPQLCRKAASLKFLVQGQNSKSWPAPWRGRANKADLCMTKK